jgi:exopolysaccharide production protein ExoZ
MSTLFYVLFFEILFAKMKRIYNLDYLRGFAAIGIMLYHFTMWSSYSEFTADAFNVRVGIFFVNIFYILSGLTLYLVYNKHLGDSKTEVYQYLKKRLFRIFPLFWVVTIVSIVISRKIPDCIILFLNLTGLFGFIKWDATYSIVAWSIGNEIVFYFLFPVFLFFFRFYKKIFIIICIITFLIFCHFTFFQLNNNIHFILQWKIYTNPLNHLFYFIIGILMAIFFEKIIIPSKFLISLLLLSILLFIYYPTSGNVSNLVTGVTRIVFLIIISTIVLCFYKLEINLHKSIHYSFLFLGEVSYSIYLLHPIVFTGARQIFKYFENNYCQIPILLKISISIILTLIISHCSFHYFEKYFIKKAKS